MSHSPFYVIAYNNNIIDCTLDIVLVGITIWLFFAANNQFYRLNRFVPHNRPET